MSDQPSHDDELRDQEQARIVDRAIDAMDQMADVVEGLQEYVISSSEQATHEKKYRLNLLWIHAVAALLLAPLFAATSAASLNSPGFAFLIKIPGTPQTEAWALWFGGIILGLGCIYRHKVAEIIGLALLGAFYTLLAFGFAVVAIWFLKDTGPATTFYAPIVYLHFAVIMWLHIVGLLIARRDEARFASLRGD